MEDKFTSHQHILDSLRIARPTPELDPRSHIVFGMEYEVRCCCTPEKVLGYLKWRSQSAHQTLACSDGSMEVVSLKIISLMEDGMPVSRYAVYSEDRPIEFWRKLRDFREVRGRS